MPSTPSQGPWRLCLDQMKLSGLRVSLPTCSPALRHIDRHSWLYGETRSALERSAWDKVTFYHQGSTEELDGSEVALASGQQIQALSCECPGSLLLASPDLPRIHALASNYNFIVGCDDSVSTPVNTDLVPFVDIVVTSLTKMFRLYRDCWEVRMRQSPFGYV
jgi:cystathionine beta-lyase/cystathionine gamma-synthase